MTSEELHAKHDIAIQLAWRDQEIERLRFRVKRLLQQHEWSRSAFGELPLDEEPVWFVVEGIVLEGTFDKGVSLDRCYFNTEDGAWCADQVSHWMPRFIEPAPAPPIVGEQQELVSGSRALAPQRLTMLKEMLDRDLVEHPMGQHGRVEYVNREELVELVRGYGSGQAPGSREDLARLLEQERAHSAALRGQVAESQSEGRALAQNNSSLIAKQRELQAALTSANARAEALEKTTALLVAQKQCTQCLAKLPPGLPSITCPHCGDQYESSEVEYDGDERDMDCPGCGAVFDITSHVTCTFTCTLRTPGEAQT